MADIFFLSHMANRSCLTLMNVAKRCVSQDNVYYFFLLLPSSHSILGVRKNASVQPFDLTVRKKLASAQPFNSAVKKNYIRLAVWLNCLKTFCICSLAMHSAVRTDTVRNIFAWEVTYFSFFFSGKSILSWIPKSHERSGAPFKALYSSPVCDGWGNLEHAVLSRSRLSLDSFLWSQYLYLLTEVLICCFRMCRKSLELNWKILNWRMWNFVRN